MQIAIAIITLVLCAGVLYWFKRSENQNVLAALKRRKTSVNVLPRKLPRNS